MPGWRVDSEVQSDYTVHVWPDDDSIEHDLTPGRCICLPALEELPSGRVLVCHHSLDGRELSEPDRRQVPNHRHVLVLHRHPDWHGHCDPHKRGFKRCDRWHWHIWYRHVH